MGASIPVVIWGHVSHVPKISGSLMVRRVQCPNMSYPLSHPLQAQVQSLLAGWNFLGRIHFDTETETPKDRCPWPCRAVRCTARAVRVDLADDERWVRGQRIPAWIDEGQIH